MNQIHFIIAGKAICVYIESQERIVFHFIEVFWKISFVQLNPTQGPALPFYISQLIIAQCMLVNYSLQVCNYY